MEIKKYNLSELSKNNKGTYGIGASAVEYNQDLYTYLRITDINEDGTLNYVNLKSVNDKNAKNYILEKGDIVFARTGNSTGKSYYYDGEIKNLVYAGFLIKFSLDREKVNPKFIKYYTMTKEYKNWVKEIQTGSTRGNINEKMYGKMIIKLPPRDYQDKMVTLLEKIDKKIELNNQINNNLYEISKRLYKRWFIDYEFPNEDGKPYKSSGGKMIYSEIGEIPENWKVQQLNKYITVERGLSYKGKFLGDSGTLMINLGNIMPNGVFRIEKNKYYNGDFKEKVIIKSGDIVVANTDMTQNREVLGTPVIIPSFYKNNKLIYSHHIFGIKDLKLPKMFTFYSMLTDRYKGVVGGSATGTTVLALPKEVIENYKIAISNKLLLEKFERIANIIQQKREDIFEENLTLEQLRDTLLPKLMNGEIDLENIEI